MRSSWFTPDEVPTAQINWQALFVGYCVGRAEWGEVRMFLGTLVEQYDITPEDLFRYVIPAFSQAVYEGRVTGAFPAFVASLKVNWFMGN